MQPTPAPRRTLLAQLAVAGIGCALLAAAVAADQSWLDRHFLPGFFVSRAEYVRMETLARAGAALLGAALIAAGRPLGRILARHPLDALAVAVAAILAVGAAELVLRRGHFRAAEEVAPTKEPLRRLDERLGWRFLPSRVGYQVSNGRRVPYAFDRNGYRVRRIGAPVDFEPPTIVFTGESMMVGEKLLWEETIPARAGALLGMQSANVSVSGFATDQAYLRLADELPRFRRPVAVVTLFAPSLFDRNLDDDRPHLDARLTWMPPARHWRLAALARRLVRYRSAESIENGIAMTREALAATVRLARDRNAIPIIVVPQFGTEEERERELRRRILDESRLPYVLVRLDPAHRVHDDGHPNPQAANAIAAAVANALYGPLSVARSPLSVTPTRTTDNRQRTTHESRGSS